MIDFSKNNVIIPMEVFTMKPNLCKKILISLLLISSTNLWASPELERIRDVGTSIENTENWTYEFTFSDNQQLKLNNDNASYTFLMVDGNIIPNLNLPIVKGKSFIPLRLLSETLGMKVQWDSSSKTAHISKDDTHLTVVARQNNEDIQIIKGSIYVSTRFIEKHFSLTASYYPYSINDQNPFNILLHPFITVDSKSNAPTLTSDQAIELAKSQLTKAYQNCLQNPSYSPETSESQAIFSTLKNDIDTITYVNKVSKYYILEGPYPILVDSITGTLYFKKDKINYSSIEEVNPSDSGIFADGYFVG